jgi:hypothetical protein
MNETRNSWIFGVAALVMLLAFTAVAYNLGVSEGLVRAGANASAAAPAAAYYGWHRGWAMGPLFPLLLIFFWFFLMRVFWWGGWWGGPRPWHFYRGPYDRETFDEWHRRAHDQMKG